jgi:hypothetical protein
MMNKAELDEALKTVLSNPYDPYDSTVLQAAQKYAELLSHLEALKGLVEAGEKATQGEWFEDTHRKDQSTLKVRSNLKLRSVNYRGSNDPTVCVLAANLIQPNDEKKATGRFILLAANTRPTISAIVKILEG